MPLVVTLRRRRDTLTRKSGDLPVAVDPLAGRDVPGELGCAHFRARSLRDDE